MDAKRISRDVLCVLVCVTWLCLPSGVAAQQEGKVAAKTTKATGVRWQPRVEYARLVLTVSGPDGKVLRQEFERGRVPVFNIVDENGLRRADGHYIYELRVIPVMPEGVSAAIRESRERGDEGATEEALHKSCRPPTQPLVQSGSFLISNGAVVSSGVESAQSPNALADFIINDDLIVLGSTCIGFDCVNGESFGADTLRLKENNLRIHFADTSTGSFPSNDWRITVNDDTSGGANRFSIDDVTGSKTPFTIRAGAPSNSLFLDSTGRMGLRTATPVLDIHMNTGDTPAIRFEQNASLAFPAQTWDIGANEANFFVRDITGGSRLPLRIRPGAPTSSIDIAANGNVGIGVVGASFKLDVSGTIRSSSGGFMFPDGTTQTTAAGGGSSVSAANVSSGSFGQNTGGGNYTFPNRLGVGSTTTPATRLQVDAGDVYITDNTKGIIMKSPNGTCRRVTLTDAGTLQVSAVIVCP
jgi:hypothetical protein